MKTNLQVQFDFSEILSGWWLITDVIAIKISQYRAVNILELHKLNMTIDFERQTITYE